MRTPAALCLTLASFATIAAAAIFTAATPHLNAADAPPNGAPAATPTTATTAAPADPAPVVHKAGDIVSKTASTTSPTLGKLDFEFGTLYVPENRGDPKSRVIGIAYARFKTTNPNPAPPTFHLPGGPGGSYMGGLKSHPDTFLRFLSAGDVVIIDQRGFSQAGDMLKFHATIPAAPLDKPATVAAGTAEFTEISKAAIADCEAKHIDLRGYTVKECAEDVNALRTALGYKQIILVGISYGSQWSFATMRLHPEIVARALLSGVEPLDMGFDMPTGIYGAQKRIFAEAEKDPRFKPYLDQIPGHTFDAAVQALVKRFNAAPVNVTVTDKAGAQVTVTLGIGDFQQDLMQAPVDAPETVLSLYFEHYNKWAQSAINRRKSRGMDLRIIGPCIDTSLGVTPGRLKRLKADPCVAVLGEWNWDAYVHVADLWPSADVGDEFRTPVITQIPVVFLQGDWDQKTPYENTTEIAQSFPHSRILIAEHGGHGVIDPVAGSCPKEWKEVMTFIETGTLPDWPANTVAPAAPADESQLKRISLGMPKFNLPDFDAPAAPAAPAAAATSAAK